MYIGNTPQNQAYTPAVDFFSGNASTTTFTLSRPVASTYQMIVVVANVAQNPGSAYTVSGNTITFASAPPTGTNNIWVEYTSLITQVIAPGQGTVGTTQLVDGSITTAKLASSFIAPEANGGTGTTIGYNNNKNRIINGAMGIWQRGTSGFTTANNYCADRFFVSTAGTLTAVAQSTDVPSGFKYSLSVAGTNVPQIYQRIESVNCTDLASQSVTISFWAKQSVGAGSGSMQLGLYYPNAIDNYSGSTLIGSLASFTGTSSWAQYTATFTNLPSGSANGLQFVLYSNVGGSSTTLVTGVQLEKGSTATSFDYRPYGTELALCQRYFTSFVGLVAFSQYGIGEAWSTTKVRFPMQCPVPMRAAPTFSTAGSGFVWAVDRIGSGVSSLTLNYATTQIQSISGTGSSLTIGQAGSINAGNFTDTSMSFSAEL